MSIMFGFLSSMVIGGVITLIVSVITHATFNKEEYVESTIKIAALNDNLSIKGNFFLGSGSVDGEMQYYYMQKSSKGMMIDSISAESSYVIEEDREDALIEYYDYRFKNSKVEYWFPNWNSGDVIVKIPKGSIMYDYKVDLQ